VTPVGLMYGVYIPLAIILIIIILVTVLLREELMKVLELIKIRLRQKPTLNLIKTILLHVTYD
jgi:hypothetical protein